MVASDRYIDSCVAASRSSAARAKRSRSNVVMVLMASSCVDWCAMPREASSGPSQGRQTVVKTGGVRFDVVLQARLLGALEIQLNGTAISASPSQRPWAVFAYLALASRSVPRTELVAR